MNLAIYHKSRYKTDLEGCYEAVNQLLKESKGKGISGNIYHYTSTKVLNSILDSGEMWATNIFFLNDKLEYQYGCNKLNNVMRNKEVVNEIRQIKGRDYDSVYSISFSEEDDILQQWITYAKESGVCIGFDWDILKNETLRSEKEGDAETNYESDYNNCIHKLYYNPIIEEKKIKEAFKDYITKVYSKENGNIYKNTEKSLIYLKLLASYMKEERFKGEKEIRASFIPEYNIKNKEWTKINYFCKDNNIISPHMNVYCLNEKEEKCWPISSITIGPGGNQEIVFESVINRIENGNNKIWNFSDKKKMGLLKKYLQDFDDSFSYKRGKQASQEKCKDYIVHEWSKRIGKEIYREGDGYTFSKKNSETSTINNIKLNAKENQKVDAFLKDNYFSSQAIWVKRSKCSYTF